jgi:hypothetical protein
MPRVFKSRSSAFDLQISIFVPGEAGPVDLIGCFGGGSQQEPPLFNEYVNTLHAICSFKFARNSARNRVDQSEAESKTWRPKAILTLNILNLVTL